MCSHTDPCASSLDASRLTDAAGSVTTSSATPPVREHPFWGDYLHHRGDPMSATAYGGIATNLVHAGERDAVPAFCARSLPSRTGTTLAHNRSAAGPSEAMMYPWASFCFHQLAPITEKVCGRCMRVVGQRTARAVTVRIVDACAHDGLDLDPVAFAAIVDGDEAQIHVNAYFTTC